MGLAYKKWLEQVSSHLYRAARRADAERIKGSDPHTGYLGLPDSYDEALRAGGLDTIAQVIEATRQDGGLQSIPGIGATKEKLILAALEAWENLSDDQYLVNLREQLEAARS